MSIFSDESLSLRTDDGTADDRARSTSSRIYGVFFIFQKTPHHILTLRRVFADVDATCILYDRIDIWTLYGIFFPIDPIYTTFYRYWRYGSHPQSQLDPRTVSRAYQCPGIHFYLFSCESRGISHPCTRTTRCLVYQHTLVWILVREIREPLCQCRNSLKTVVYRRSLIFPDGRIWYLASV